MAFIGWFLFYTYGALLGLLFPPIFLILLIVAGIQIANIGRKGK